MAAASPTFTLNTGAKIPAVGLGTWQSEKGQVAAAVYHALKSGYRHIDAAFVYGNENEVGQGLQKAFKDGMVKREDVFITSKLWCTYHRKAEECLNEGLKRLQLDYVDLYLMHWPVPMSPNGNHELFPKHPDGSRDLDTEWKHTETWKELERLLQTGKTKAIGVSNYSVKFLEELLPTVKVVPAVNQIENHPYLPQQDVVDYCSDKGIKIEAYSPLGSTGSPLFKEEGVQKLAEKYNVSPGTILISYQGERPTVKKKVSFRLLTLEKIVSKGHIVLPKSVTLERIEANLKTIQFDSEDLQALEAIHKTKGTTRFVYPEFGVNLGFPDKQ